MNRIFPRLQFARLDTVPAVPGSHEMQDIPHAAGHRPAFSAPRSSLRPNELRLAEEGLHPAEPSARTKDDGMREMKGPADFIEPRYSVRRARESASRAAGALVAKAGVGVAGGVALAQKVANDTAPAATFPAKDAMMLGVVALSNQHLGKWLVQTTDAAFIDGFPEEIALWEEWHQESKQQAAAQLGQAPSWIREPVDKIDRRLQTLFEAANRAERVDEKDEAATELREEVDLGEIERLMRWRQLFFLERPTCKKEVEGWKTPEGRRRLLEQIDHRLASYPPEYRDEIKAMLVGIASQSLMPVGADGNSRPQYLLRGKPGTGKDHIVYELVDKLLGLPVIELSIPDEESGGADALLGTPGSKLEKEDFPTNDETLLGLLVQAKMRCRHTNPVLYISEVNLADKNTRNVLKRELDRGKDHIEVPGLETQVDFKDDIVIISTNDDDAWDDDGGLQDRMTSILKLDNTLPETQRKAALNEFRHAAAPYCLPIEKPAQDLDDEGHWSADEDDAGPGHPPRQETPGRSQVSLTASGGVTGSGRAGGAPGAVLTVQQQGQLEGRFMDALPLLLAAHAHKSSGVRMQYAARLSDYIATGLIEGTVRSDEEIVRHINRHHHTRFEAADLHSLAQPADTPTAPAQASDSLPVEAQTSQLQSWLSVQHRAGRQALRQRRRQRARSGKGFVPPHLLPNSYSPRRALRSAGKHLWTATREAASLAGVVSAISSQLSPATVGGFSMRGLLPMAWTVPAVQTTGKLAYGMWNALYKDGRRGRLQAIEDAHKLSMAQVQAQGLLENAPPWQQHAVRKCDRRLAQLCRRVEHARKKKKPVRKQDRTRIEYLWRWRNEFLLGRPTQRKEVEAWKTAEGRAELLQRVDRKLQAYPPQYRDKLKAVATSIAAHSVQTVGEFDMRRLQIALTGIPGTGKDHFVYSVLRDELGLDVQQLSIPNKKNGGARKLLGGTWPAMDQEDYATEDEDLVGLLGLKLLKARYTNSVIYISEVDLQDKETRNILKKVLDPAKKLLDAPALETKIEFRHNVVLISSNDLKDPGDDGALWDRMDEEIELAYTTAHAKRLAAEGVFEKALQKHCTPITGDDGSVRPAVLDAAQTEALRDGFSRVKSHLVQAQTQACQRIWGTDGGARMDFAEMLTDLMVVGLMTNRPLDEPELKRLIDAHYGTSGPAGAGEGSTRPVEAHQAAPSADTARARGHRAATAGER